ncbi:branched-chain amino acid ABC transporter permease [Deferribacterales bacterium RsTz2092]|nr:branched-chain amino acid ABC transporter permease [Deferribacterales bacterium]
MVIQQLLNGLTLGGIYALIALGYTMIYGIVKLINFAHGDVFMLGAFVGFYVAVHFSSNFIVVILVAMAFCMLLGLLIERTAYRPLRSPSASNLIGTVIMVGVIAAAAFLGRNGMNTLFTSAVFYEGLALIGVVIFLLAKGKIRVKHAGASGTSRINALITAIGMSIVLSNTVAIINGPQRVTFPPVLELGSWNVAGMNISGLQLFIITASLVLMFILYFIVHKTKAGMAMRAVSQNINAARLMGINPDKVIGFTFALGSALAAAAGVLVGVFYTVADPNMGSMYGLKAFVAAVFGGIGSLPGAMVGGFALGVAEVFGVAFIAPAFRDAIAFGILILVLIIKPTGIFGSNVKEKV